MIKAMRNEFISVYVVSLFQDPVYGKGKLAEIQGLILGMLETFNYEQVMCVLNGLKIVIILI